MAKRAPWMLLLLTASAVTITAARAQDSEYEALPEPATAAAAPAPTENQAKAAEPKHKSGDKAAVKDKAAPATVSANAAGEKKAGPGKEKEEDLPLGRRMAPSAAIPALPGDEKGPKTVDFLGNCASDYDRCMQLVRDIGEKLPASDLCVPEDLYFNTVTERVRKWATLRPDIHGLPAGRVIAAALRSIYPCKHTPPSRTAAEKGAPKAKAAQ